MKSSKMLVAISAVALSVSAMGAGFGLYEASARGVGMGNGLVGSTKDATANYHNPANLTELSDPTVTVGMTLINPFCDVKVDGVYQNKMNAGWFPPPHAYAALPLGETPFVLGFGTYCEFGLGTKYDGNWLLKADTTETTIEQFTFNPNIAYRITDDWSVAFGARMSYMTFENFKSPILYGQIGQIPYNSHLKGDDFNCGYVLATQYKVTDKLSLGLVYRSRINHKIEGDLNLRSPYYEAIKTLSGDAKAKVVLPSSVVMGANYDFTESFRGGVSVTWTEWSTLHHIDFNLPTGVQTQKLNWHDSWRIGFGFEYDFTSALTGRIGYSYDCDPSSKSNGTTMLPSGDRHIVGFGAGYRFSDSWSLDLGYNFIIMESETRIIEDYRFQCDNSYSHIISASVTYTF